MSLFPQESGVLLRIIFFWQPMNPQNNEPDYSYLDLLNPQQREAVVYHDGPSLVIAGAGSGKTRVLTYKIVDLINHGFEPFRILALTFTNKAAREMKERVAAAVDPKVASRLWMGTFHSVFLRILRSHADQIGYRRDFTIYDAADSKALIKSIIKDMALDEKTYKPSTIASIISNAKNSLVSAEAYMADKASRDADKRANRPLTAYIYSTYQKRCRSASAMDFDDILFQMNLLLRDFPDICRHYQEFFRFILVDEYQDTNFAQHLIISRLAGENMKLCVVGDDAQSIYSFRGANISNILNLSNNFQGLKVFKLERNYRSTQNIINAAGSLIDKNTSQIRKNVYSENEAGSPVAVISTYSDLEEAFLVANKIAQTQLTCHDSLDEYAILYRTNAQSRQLEESLRKRSIPYRIYGGLSFYQRKEVKDAICYFRLTVNPHDDEALRRVINFPARGIGETTLKKLTHAAIESGKSIWEVLGDPSAAGLTLNAGTMRKLNSFHDLIDDFFQRNQTGENAHTLGSYIFSQTGLISMLLHDKTPESISKKENLEELLAGLNDFVEQRSEEGKTETGISDYLSEISLATDQDQGDDNDTPKVTMMTVHAAKGLEFKHVWIVGIEEELFPSAMSMDSLSQIEEERRLLYVAITRAKSTCTMTFAKSRFRNGQSMMTRPSRFLYDIDRKYLNIESSSKFETPSSGFVDPSGNYWSRQRIPSATPGRQSSFADRQYSNSTPSPDNAMLHSPEELKIGTRINHSRFGKGTVTAISDISGDPMIAVRFDQVGDKKLLLKFARFTIE